MLSLDIVEHILAFIVVVLLGGVVHGFTGFGFGLVSMSLFALLDLPLERASALLTVVSVPILLTFAITELRRKMPKPLPTLLALVGMILVVPIGYVVILVYGGTTLFSVGFGIFVLALAIWRLSRISVRAPIAVGWGPLFGFAGGFIGGAVVSGGPAVVVYLYANAEDPRDEKSALQLIFLCASVTRAIATGSGSAGLSWEMAALGLLIFPLPLALIFLANRFSRKISVERFRQTTYLFLLLVGVMILVKAATESLFVS